MCFAVPGSSRRRRATVGISAGRPLREDAVPHPPLAGDRRSPPETCSAPGPNSSGAPSSGGSRPTAESRCSLPWRSSAARRRPRAAPVRARSHGPGRPSGRCSGRLPRVLRPRARNPASGAAAWMPCNSGTARTRVSRTSSNFCQAVIDGRRPRRPDRAPAPACPDLFNGGNTEKPLGPAFTVDQGPRAFRKRGGRQHYLGPLTGGGQGVVNHRAAGGVLQQGLRIVGRCPPEEIVFQYQYLGAGSPSTLSKASSRPPTGWSMASPMLLHSGTVTRSGPAAPGMKRPAMLAAAAITSRRPQLVPQITTGRSAADRAAAIRSAAAEVASSWSEASGISRSSRWPTAHPSCARPAGGRGGRGRQWDPAWWCRTSPDRAEPFPAEPLPGGRRHSRPVPEFERHGGRLPGARAAAGPGPGAGRCW